MFEKFAIWFIIFMIYSFCGWIAEVIVSIVMHHKFINRGFLLGPICPIYGVGAVAFSLLFSWLDNPWLIFLTGFICGAILEYFTSFILEKLFHVRWWDYSKFYFNLNGRICLHCLLCFALVALIVHYFTTPWLYNLLEGLYSPILITIASGLATWLVIDIIISLWLMFGVRVTAGMVNHGEDDTEMISRRMHEALMNKGKLHRRMAKAFPNQTPSKKQPRKRQKSAKRKA